VISNRDEVSTRKIAYTFENMPARIDQPEMSVPMIKFTYDGNNRRVIKESSAKTIYYIGKHFEMVNGTPTRYIFAGNLRLAKVTPSVVQYYHKDHLLNSVTVSNVAGNAVQAQDFIPFGQEREKSGQRATNYLYTDQEFDQETGLYNFEARLYDPSLGLFITPDPYFSPNLVAHLHHSKRLPTSLKPNDYARYFSSSQKLNRYAYTSNNPINALDPFGLFTSPWYLQWVPGQHFFDRSITAFEGGHYAWGAAYMAGMVGEQLLSVLPFGKSMAGTGAVVYEANVSKSTAIQKYYPDNNGFLGATERKFLMKGDRIDRIGGSDFSRFFSPEGTPIAARSLPAESAQQPLRIFEVLKPFEVEAGKIAPAFGQLGYGTQYRTPVQMKTLIDRGIIHEITQ
jgi:RHS repeat-associated protein